jgi:hypothetical protein
MPLLPLSQFCAENLKLLRFESIVNQRNSNVFFFGQKTLINLILKSSQLIRIKVVENVAVLEIYQG